MYLVWQKALRCSSIFKRGTGTRAPEHTGSSFCYLACAWSGNKKPHSKWKCPQVCVPFTDSRHHTPQLPGNTFRSSKNLRNTFCWNQGNYPTIKPWGGWTQEQQCEENVGTYPTTQEKLPKRWPASRSRRSRPSLGHFSLVWELSLQPKK